MTRLLLAVAAVLLVSAPVSAQETTPTTPPPPADVIANGDMGGGFLPNARQAREGQRAVLVSTRVRGRGNNVSVLVYTTVDCAGELIDIELRAAGYPVDFDGTLELEDFDALDNDSEKKIIASFGAFVTFRPDGAIAKVTVRARRKGKPCRGAGVRTAELRPRELPEGSPEPDGDRTVLLGLTTQTVAGDFSAPFIVRTSPGGRTITEARYMTRAKCTRGYASDIFENILRKVTVRDSGGFTLDRNFKIRYSDAHITFRQAFKGTITPRGGQGTLRLRESWTKPNRTRVLTTCDTGPQQWSAVRGR